MKAVGEPSEMAPSASISFSMPRSAKLSLCSSSAMRSEWEVALSRKLGHRVGASCLFGVRERQERDRH